MSLRASHSSNDTPSISQDMETISKMGPTITMGSAKAQGLKAKPTGRVRAARVRDEATQWVASSWHIQSPIKGT
jgi:hypothetical protein